MTGPHPAAPLPAVRHGGAIRTRRWFAFFAAWLVSLLAGCVLIMLQDPPNLDFSGWAAFKKSVNATPAALRLMIIALYLSLACTFTLLNTSWLISAAAIAPGITGELYSTVFLISVAGAAGSTVANLNDYHIFTLMLRSRRIAKIRNTRGYALAERWFSGYPFGILMFFNIAPIPVDVSRPLAAAYGYPRTRFAAANFLGRAIRYGIIAALTYMLADHGWIATVCLIAVAVLIVLVKLAIRLVENYGKRQ